MARTVVVQGGGSSAGILLLFLGIVGLVALFTGNLDRWIDAIAGGRGGAAGIGGSPAPADTVYPAPAPGGKPADQLPKGGTGKVGV